jgi:hypothetical protein
MVFDINKEVQHRHPDALVMVRMDGLWDLATLLSVTGSYPLNDLRIYRDYMEAKDQAHRESRYLSSHYGADYAAGYPAVSTVRREWVVADGFQPGQSVRLQADHEPGRLLNTYTPTWFACGRHWKRR